MKMGDRIPEFRVNEKSKELVLIIKNECSNNCNFCTTRLVHGKNKFGTDSKDSILKIIDSNKERGLRITFVAFEPLEHPDIVEVIESSKKSGYTEIEMITNGRRFSDKKFAKRIYDAGLNHADILLLGHESGIHDKITQRRGSFSETVRGIENLKESGFKFTAHSVITKQNYQYLYEILDFCSVNNIQFKGFKFVSPSLKEPAPYLEVVFKMEDLLKFLKAKQGNYPEMYTRKILDNLNKDVPICLISKYFPESLKLNLRYKTTEAKYMKKYRSMEPRPEKKHEFKDKYPCEFSAECTKSESCPGMYAQYISLFGKHEFEPIRTSKTTENRNFGYMQLTRKCNRKCVCSNLYIDDTLSFKDALRQIDDYVQEGVNEIIFTGGEPTLNKNIFRLIKYCNKKGLACRVITNGEELADKAYTKRLSEAGLSYINISIYSHKKNVQDKLTLTKGSHEKTLSAIENSLKYITVPNINITINELNVEHLDDTVKVILEKFPDIMHFVFNNLDPTGRALKNKWTIPRLLDMEPGLQRVMKYLITRGKTFRVERVPLCYMRGFEYLSTETRKIVKNEIYRCLFLNKEGRELRKVRDFYYDKAPCCKICFLNEICAGLNPRYTKLFGFGELFPVFSDPEQIKREIMYGK